MRALPEGKKFVEFLLSVGNGTLNNSEDYINIPEHCIAYNNANIVNDVYGGLIKNKLYEDFTKVIDLLDSTTEKVYTSIDSVENCDNGDINDAILPEYLNTINPPNFPPHELRLKLYSVVMLIRNLSIDEGLCNGTRLMILELGNNLLKCKILTGNQLGHIVFINRITLYYDNANAFTFKRRQIPMRVAFGMTINKSQGQTFDKIGIDLRKDVFNHGQFYVAISRVKSWQSLKIHLNNDRGNNLAKNYVYKELFDTE
ncbi:ATP-dependent DNA helicase PIF1-like [Microplitis mediator]|uniref:ATP-dependent DNA helicase PIF1-like n=1 Tax=Microplitis mediator TaxID=375433 RepID=UPI0025555BAF|nr:ATP-dependent DNA helicase PIF1-like [Microplitis mediator]